MPFLGSDLWRVRQKWGSDPLMWPGVTVLVMNEDNKIWLGKRSDSGKWSVAGGLFEIGDSAFDAARREVKEELGEDILQLEMIGVLTDPKLTNIEYPNGDKLQSPSHIFIAHIKNSNCLPDDEHTAFEWLDFEAAEKRILEHGGNYSKIAIQMYRNWLKTKQFQIQ